VGSRATTKRGGKGATYGKKPLRARDRSARTTATTTKKAEILFLDFVRWGFDNKGWSKDTRRNYRLRVRAADLWMREVRSKTLIGADQRSLKDYLFHTPANARNRNHIRQALIAFYTFLEKEGYRQDNPAAGLPRLPTPKSLPKAITTEEASRALRAARVFGPKAEALVTLLFYTGMRRGEARILEWSWIQDEWIRFWSSKSRTEREIPLHPQLALALAKWRPLCRESVYVFPSRNPDKPMSAAPLGKLVREVGEMAGIHLYPHLCRHTCATTLMEKGVELRTLQEWLGHASPQTTAIYTRVRSPRLKEASDVLDYGPPKQDDDD
jgi:integrase/recombinase XerD